MMQKIIAQPRTRNTKTIDDIASIAIFLAAFGAAWQVIYLAGVLPQHLLPSPISVAESFADLTMEGSLGASMAVTMGRLAIGFTIAVAVGGAVGLAMVRFKDFGKTMGSFAVGLQSFPSIAWVPFAILLFGYNDFGILFVVIIGSVFALMIATYSGMRSISPIYIRAARNMGARGLVLFRHVMIPAATPTLIIGVRQAWSFAWHALVGAEILMSIIGLGHILFVGREFINMGWIMATMIVIFVVGMVADRVVFYKLEDRIRSRWGLNQQSE